MKLQIKPLLLFFAIIFHSGVLLAQTGTIKGSIKDDVNEEIIIGATIMLQGTGTGTVTDFDGNFVLKNVQPGTYNLVFSYLSYKSDTLRGVKVVAGQITTVNQKMKEDASVFEEVVILGVQQKNTEEAVIKEVKEADQVVSAISAEQISKSQDRDAAQVIKRIPGITLIDGKFVVVRGLSQRYNAVLLNGASAPSTEPEMKAFAFDIINSSMIDRLLIYKSGAADLPGEFAGSVIQVYTKNVPNENYLRVGLSTSYRAGTTFGNFKQDGQFSTADYFTMGLNDRRWNPSVLAYRIPEEAVAAGKAAKLFQNNWVPKSTTALPDMNFSLQSGRKFMLFGKDFSNVTDVSYSNTYLYKESVRGQYYLYEPNGSSETRGKLYDDEYDNESSLNILSNFAALLNENNKVSFNNSYVRIGNSEVLARQGFDYLNERDLNNFSYRYQSRAIYSGQLTGDHKFNQRKSVLNWVAGYSNTSREEPDWRQVRSQRAINTNGPYFISVGTPNQVVRFNSDLKDNAFSGKIDLSHLLSGTADTAGVKIKGGAFYESSDREYQARLIQYKESPGGNYNPVISTLPIDQMMEPQNLGFPNGLIVNEATTKKDKYTANSTLVGGHVGAIIPFWDMFNLAVGGRVEMFNQQLDGHDGAKPQKVDITYVNPLPFANLSYNITEQMLVRAAYGKTVNRPAFRELAPFQFYDFNMNAQITGNPELIQADIQNFDLRWELYPTPVEAISFGVFHKEFYNPIEMIYRQSENYNFTFRNAKAATATGVELEVRKSAANVFPETFFKDFSLLFNASLIYSEIKLDGSIAGLKQNRPMQGQSPYVINTGIYYSLDDKGINASLMYNVYGQRTFFVGDAQTRSVYEMPRNLIDLTVSVKTGEKGEVRLGISDLLNAPVRFYEDGDASGKIERNNANDKVFYEYRRGQRFTVGYSYKF